MYVLHLIRAVLFLFVRVYYLQTIVLCLFIFSGLVAQDNTKLITLEYYWEKPIKADFYIVEVVDARPSRDAIGIIQIGGSDKNWKTKFENGLKQEFLNLFNVLLPPNKQKRALKVKINQLWISEMTNITFQIGRMEVELEFLEKIDSSFVSVGVFNKIVEKSYYSGRRHFG